MYHTVGKFGGGDYAWLQKWIDGDFGKIVRQMNRCVQSILIVTAKLTHFLTIWYIHTLYTHIHTHSYIINIHVDTVPLMKHKNKN